MTVSISVFKRAASDAQALHDESIYKTVFNNDPNKLLLEVASSQVLTFVNYDKTLFAETTTLTHDY